MIKLIFFGSPQNAADLLAKLDKDSRFKVVAVVTQTDRPIGRKQIRTPTPVAQYAKSNNIFTLKPPRHPQKKHLLKNPKKLKNQIKNLLPKTPKGPKHPKKTLNLEPRALNGAEGALILSYDFGQLIPPEILALPRLGGLNIHFSLLPSYRGAAPIPWQIANGETQTGISVVKISPKFDKGALVWQEVHPIKPSDTTQTLHQRLSTRVLAFLPDLLVNYAAGSLPDYPHSPDLPDSYYPRLTRQTGFVSWEDFFKSVQGNSPKIAVEIERKIRAFSPWPGVWTIIESGKWEVRSGKGKRLKILSAKLENGKLVPQKVQLEGERSKSWKEFSKQTLLLTLYGKQDINQLHNSNG